VVVRDSKVVPRDDDPPGFLEPRQSLGWVVALGGLAGVVGYVLGREAVSGIGGIAVLAAIALEHALRFRERRRAAP
jgi:hypothetical protein